MTNVEFNKDSYNKETKTIIVYIPKDLNLADNQKLKENFELQKKRDELQEGKLIKEQEEREKDFVRLEVDGYYPWLSGYTTIKVDGKLYIMVPAKFKEMYYGNLPPRRKQFIDLGDFKNIYKEMMEYFGVGRKERGMSLITEMEENEDYQKFLETKTEEEADNILEKYGDKNFIRNTNIKEMLMVYGYIK